MSCRRTKLPHEFYAWEDDVAGALDPALKTAAVFGYKPKASKRAPAGREALRRVVCERVEKLYREGYRQFLTGICGEFERCSLDALLELRDGRPDVRLVLVLGRREHLSIYSQSQPIPWAYRTADSVVAVEDRDDRVAFALSHCSALVYSYRGLYAPALLDSFLPTEQNPDPALHLIDVTDRVRKAADKPGENGGEEGHSQQEQTAVP